MRQNRGRNDAWEEPSDDAMSYEGDAYGYPDEQGQDLMPYPDQRGLQTNQPAPPMPSLVNVSATVTNYGAPLLSYSRTMQRFYQLRKQVMSLGRHKCAICGDRIGGWAWIAPNGGHAHDGCYDRLAWAWATVYAEQQHMTTRGE